MFALRVIIVCVVSAVLVPIGIAFGVLWSGAHHVHDPITLSAHRTISELAQPADLPARVEIGLSPVRPLLPDVVIEMPGNGWAFIDPPVRIDTAMYREDAEIDLILGALDGRHAGSVVVAHRPIHAPEPGPLVLLGGAGLGLTARRRR